MNDFKIQKKSFSNNLTALVMEDHRLPLVSIQAVFQGGLRVEDEKTNGLTNFMSRMLLKGTKKRSVAEIDSVLEEKGGEISHFCGQNSFGLNVEVLSTDTDLALEVLSDILFNPTFPESQIEKVRERILAEIKAEEDDVFETAINLLKSTLFKVHPYQWPLVGRRETVEKFKRQDLEDFYRHFVRSNPMVISVFGDIDSQRVLQTIENKFIHLAKKRPPQLKIAQEPKLEIVRSQEKKLEKEQTVLIWGFPAVDVKNPDRYGLEVLRLLLGGEYGRCFEEIRDKSGLAYSLGAFLSLGLDPGFLGLYVSTSPEKLSLVKEKLHLELQRLQTELVTDAELQEAKNYLRGQHLLSLQTNSSLAQRASLDELYGLGYDNFKQYTSRIDQVTKEEINRLAKKYLNFNAYAEAIVTPQENRLHR